MKNTRKLALIGGGQMGRAMVGGVLAKNQMNPVDVHLVEPNRESCQWWEENYPEISIEELSIAISKSDAVMLAVKPNIVAKVTKQDDGFWEGKLVVSIAAGVGLADLAAWVGHGRVIRVMPNTPAMVGAGASGFCCGSDVTDEDRDWISGVLDSVGICVEVDERQMDAVTGLSGSGPAYVCLIVEALADGGVKAGLPRPLAMQLATQTVLGTATMIAQTGRHPGELKDAVTSPGGTTIAGLSVLEQNGLRGILIEAVAAAARRSEELGKSS